MSRRTIALLVTESKKDFVRRRKKLADQIGPSGPVEQEYVHDLAYTHQEIDRYRRIGTGILNGAIPEALEHLLELALPHEDFETSFQRDQAAKDLARRALNDKAAWVGIIELLRKHRLDESAIEAEAFRLRASDLEAIERILSVKQSRRDNNLGVIGEMRQGSLEFLQAATESARTEAALTDEDEDEEEDNVPHLISASKARG